MNINLKNWQNLPQSNIDTSKIVIQSEWSVMDAKEQLKALEKIKETFEKYLLNHPSVKGQISYSCFLNDDGKYIIHFSQWKDKDAINEFDKNDPKERIPEMLSGLKVTRLGKQIYYPYKSYSENSDLTDTGLVVFVKQYFKRPGEATEWIDMILETLHLEAPIEGLIENTFYVDENKTEFLNLAYWKDEKSYEMFLKHPTKKTKKNWEMIENYSGRKKSEGIIKRHSKFLRLQ